VPRRGIRTGRRAEFYLYAWNNSTKAWDATDMDFLLELY
jgi:hypothetical protein